MDRVGDKEKIKNLKQKESAYKSPFFFLSAIFLFAVSLDQAAKHLARNNYKNAAFAFSLPLPNWLMYFIYFAVTALMVNYVYKQGKNFSLTVRVAWTLIFAGAASNIVERIVLGSVRDFIYISFSKWTGVYNLADFYIIAGIIFLLLPPSSLSYNKNDVQSF